MLNCYKRRKLLILTLLLIVIYIQIKKIIIIQPAGMDSNTQFNQKGEEDRGAVNLPYKTKLHSLTKNIPPWACFLLLIFSLIFPVAPCPITFPTFVMLQKQTLKHLAHYICDKKSCALID